MAAHLEIESVLSLDTSVASKKLNEVLSAKIPSQKLDIDTSVASRKLNELDNSASSIRVNPSVDTKEIDKLVAQLLSLRNQEVAIAANVNDTDIALLMKKIEKLKSQSELKLRLSSEAKDIVVGSQGQKYGAELIAIAREQSKLTKDSIREQQNTQQTIRKESSNRLGNIVQKRVAQAGIDSVKSAVIKEFAIDTQSVEKILGKILPSSRMVADDIKKYISDVTKDSPVSKAITDFRKGIVGDLADASVAAEDFGQWIAQFKNLASENSVDKFTKDLSAASSEIKGFKDVLNSLGLNADRLTDGVLNSTSAKSVTRSASNVIAPQLAKRKDSIQSDRIETVLNRAQELINQDIKEIANDASSIANSTENIIGAIADTTEELLLTIGGYTDDIESGSKTAEQINKQFRKKGELARKRAVGIKGSDTAITGDENSMSQLFSLARPNIRGYSKDAEEIAAQAIAALVKNPKLRIKVVGESGGGLPAQEAVEILNKAGFSDRVSGIGTGTPIFRGRTANPKNFTPYIGVNEKENVGYRAKEDPNSMFVDPRIQSKTAKKSQSMKGLSGHSLPDYLKMEEVREFVYGEKTGRQQKNAKASDIKKLREDLKQNIVNSAISQSIDAIRKFENDTRITGASIELFDELKKDIALLDSDIQKGLIEYLDSVAVSIRQVPDRMESALDNGDTEYFTTLKKIVDSVTIELSKIGLKSSELTKDYVNSLQNDIKKVVSQIPENLNPQTMKAEGFKKRVDTVLGTLNQIDPQDAIATITDIEPTLKEYLKEVRSLDDSDDKKKIQKSLEEQLKTIKTAKKLALLAVEFDFGELVKNPGQYLKLIKDSGMEKAKESAKKRSLDAAKSVAIATSNTIDNFVDDLKDRLLEAANLIQNKAIGGSSGTKALPGNKGGAITVADAGQAALVRAIADSVALTKGSYNTLQKIEQAIFTIVPMLRTAKSVAQVAAPIAGGIALTSMSPELAQLAKLSAHELATVIEPLLMASRAGLANIAGDAVANLPGIGGASRAVVQALINNPALNAQIAGGTGAIATYGAIGGGASAITKAGARLAGRKTYDALPESLQKQLSPESIAAFDTLVASRQSEIKQIASGLNKQIAALKQSGDADSGQKLLAGYQQIKTEVAELEKIVGSSSKSALKLTRDRIEELKGIEKSLGKVISQSIGKAKSDLGSLFGVEISGSNDTASKTTFRKAVKAYRQEIIDYRAKLDKKILNSDVTDSDFEAGDSLAKRGNAIASALKQAGGYNKESRAIADVSTTLQSRIPNDPNRIKAGEDVVNGILEGSNQKLAEVFIQGRSIGKELLHGFKTELGIKSPSKEFEKQGKNIADGIDKGVSNNLSEISESGDRAGDKLVGSFKKSIATIKDSVKPATIALAKTANTTKGREVIKDAVVNTSGAIANVVAQSKSNVPGIGLATEYVASTAARKAVEDIESVLDAASLVLKKEVNQTASTLDLFNQIVKQSVANARNKSQSTRSKLDTDSVGFAIGNAAAIASKSLGATIPLIGAAVASVTTKQATVIKNQILEQINPSAIARNTVLGLSVGINQQLSNVNKEGHRLARKFADGFNDQLGIRSPSGWGKERITWIAKGLAIGAINNTLAAVQSGERIGKAVKDGFNKSDATKLRAKTVSGVNNSDSRIKEIEDAIALLKKSRAELVATVHKLNDQDKIAVGKSVAKIRSQIERGESKLAAIKATRSQQQPISLTQGDNQVKSASNQVKKTIASITNELKQIGLENATKEAKKASSATKDLLVSLQSTIVEGKKASSKIKQAESSIAILEKNRSNFIKMTANLKGEDRKAAQSVTSRIQSQIANEKARIDALKLQQSEAKKLTSIYKQLQQQELLLQRAIASKDTKGINRINRDINETFKRLNQSPPTSGGGFIGKIQGQLDKLGISAKNVKKTIAGLAGLAISSFFIGDISSTIRDLGAVAIRFEEIQTKMNFATGGAKEGADAFRFVGDRAKALKIDIEAAAQGYTQLAASTKNNEVLKKSTDEIFNSIMQANRVSGGTAENANAAFTAIQQSISGGTVQLEELRQLGESGGIPDVFGLAARSLNMTTSEMKKMVSTGTLLTEDFLPKFSRELTKATRIGLAPSLRTTSAALQDVRNEFKLLQVAIGQGAESSVKKILEFASTSLRFTRDHLGEIATGIKAIALLITTALLPAAVGLAKTVGVFLVNGLKQVAVALIGVSTGMTKAQIASKLLFGSIAAIGAVLVVEQVAEAFVGLSNAGMEARDAVAGINQAGIDLQKTLNDINKTEVNPDLVKQITESNKKAIADDLNFIQKAMDKEFSRFGNNKFRLGYQDAAESRVKAFSGEAISANQKVLNEISEAIGSQSIGDIPTEELDAFVKTLGANTSFLDNAASKAVDSVSYNGIQAEIAENDRLTELYNKELERRNGLELNLSKIMTQKQKAVTEASRTEVNGIKSIDESILKSGDFKKDVELEKLNYTRKRIDAELEAEKTALNQIMQLAIAQGKIDADTGEMNDTKQIEEYKKSEEKIIELTRSAVENRQSILAKETEQKIAEYDRYVKAIDDRINVYQRESIAAEKERLIELQGLRNDDLISQEQLDDAKGDLTRDRIKEDIELEQDRLSDLERFRTKDKELRKQNDDAIAASREKILDLTLQSLESEKEAEEKTINYISTLRDKAADALEKRLSRLQTLYQTESQLLGDRASAQQRLKDIEVNQLRKALELRRQLNGEELDPSERKLALTQLLSLGIKGKTDELSILKQIQSKEDAIAKAKIAALQIQQKLQQKQLEIEIMQLQISTQKSAIEAKKAQRDAQIELNGAEKAIASATTDEELKAAFEAYDLAKLGLELANDQIDASQKEQEMLAETIRLKREILDLNQAGDRAELGVANQDQRDSLAKDKLAAKESRSRRGNQFDPSVDISRYLNRSESIEKAVDKRKSRFESRGEEFDAESEQKLRDKLNRKYQVNQNQADNNTARFINGNPGFSATAPIPVIDAIVNKFKGLSIPSLPNGLVPPLQTVNVGATTNSNDTSILNALKAIESKFTQPAIVNVQNDNHFINQYDKSNTDSMLDKVRSEIVDGINAIARDPRQFLQGN